ncbi:MAG: efflux RND transporter periplasmic adaptor subunit [Bermanella sp.]
MKSPFSINPIFAQFSLGLAILAGSSTLVYAEDHGHDEEEAHQEEQKGSHGGQIFRAGHASVELTIIEDGVDPQYRAWISEEGEAITEDADLSVQISRLGGGQTSFEFSSVNNKGNNSTDESGYWQGNGIVEEPHSFDVTVTLNHEGETHSWDFESHEGRVEIKADIAQKAGITTQKVGAGEINQTLTVYGKAVADTSKISHIEARFPGIIKRVNVSIGDKVKKGQVLATIESNESLNRYNVTAPFSGTITARHAAQGEQSEDQALFTLANFDSVWAEFQIFPTQSQRIAAGQDVVVSLGDRQISTTLKHLIPSTNGQPFMIARALLDNSNGQWTPGLLVEGKVTVKKVSTPLLVSNKAIQTFRDWQVAFIKVGNEYEIRPLTLGLSDDHNTQVLSGLKAGDEYVVENSYLIKADLEKSGASHDH